MKGTFLLGIQLFLTAIKTAVSPASLLAYDTNSIDYQPSKIGTIVFLIYAGLLL